MIFHLNKNTLIIFSGSYNNVLIFGTVLNNSTGIEDVTISANTTINSNTDATGFYSLLVPTGNYNLIATSEPKFYPNSSINVTIVAGTTLMQNIELMKKSTGNIRGSVSAFQ